MSALPLARTALLGLRGIRLLEGLDTAALEALARALDWRHCAAGQQVITRNAADRDVYLVVSGKVQVVAFSASGRQITYREMGAGEHFGELAAIDGRARSADVIALEESLLATMRPETFRALLVSHEPLRERMLCGLVSFVREMTDRVFELIMDLHRELGTTLVLVTHDLRLAPRMEACLHLERGRMGSAETAAVAP